MWFVAHLESPAIGKDSNTCLVKMQSWSQQEKMRQENTCTEPWRRMNTSLCSAQESKPDSSRKNWNAKRFLSARCIMHSALTKPGKQKTVPVPTEVSIVYNCLRTRTAFILWIFSGAQRAWALPYLLLHWNNYFLINGNLITEGYCLEWWILFCTVTPTDSS